MIIDWTTIIVAIIGALAGGGLTGLLTFKHTKEGKKLDNKDKEVDIENKQRDQAIEEWKSIAEERRIEAVEKVAELKIKEAKLEEKDAIITDLREKLDHKRTECAVADLIKCRDISCQNRVPKLGTKDAFDVDVTM